MILETFVSVLINVHFSKAYLILAKNKNKINAIFILFIERWD